MGLEKRNLIFLYTSAQGKKLFLWKPFCSIRLLINYFKKSLDEVGKRLFDIIVSLVVLIILSPFLLIIALLVRLNLGRPILFKQVRPGLNEKTFKMIKFRTMTDECDEEGNLLPNHKRLTRFGRILRASSLDELPELWNVLKGDMSLVGPRPLLVEYLPLYNEEQRKRHQVRPGITGWAQVNGRNAISWDERFKLDIWYVENRTFWLDLKILLLTVKKVLSRADINAGENVTMPKFIGSKKNERQDD